MNVYDLNVSSAQRFKSFYRSVRIFTILLQSIRIPPIPVKMKETPMRMYTMYAPRVTIKRIQREMCSFILPVYIVKSGCLPL